MRTCLPGVKDLDQGQLVTFEGGRQTLEVDVR